VRLQRNERRAGRVVSMPVALLLRLLGMTAVSLTLARAATPEPDTAPARPDASQPGSDTNWPFYNRELTGARFSPLAQINANNVAALQEVCRVVVSRAGPFSSSITMVDGLLYVTSTLATMAVNATDCAVEWKSNYVLEEKQVFNTHRGVGYGDGLVIRGTTDGRLLAYDARTGVERWRTKIGEPQSGEFVSSAPQVWDGKVFVGIAGSDWGIHGRMMAFDLRSGRQLWSFDTIPQQGEAGVESWAGDSWQRGGGGTWTSYTIDPRTHELFVPVGNPAMSWNGAGREGANLYSNSVLVLDTDSGHYRWHYQALAHDTHDFDVTSPPVLATLRDGRQIMAVTPKDGFLYVVDRRTHRLRYKVAATTILNQDKSPSPEGVHVCPGIYGGSEWNGPAFDPGNQTLITADTDWCATIRQMVPAPEYTRGKLYMGGSHVMDKDSGGWVTAFDARSGKVRWQHRTAAPLASGITPTAGGVTFLGDMAGRLYAFRSSDGKVLREMTTGGAIAGGVITYRVAGRQYVAVTSGNISRSSWPNASGIPSVVIYALPQAESAGGADPGDPDKGRRLFGAICAGCHGESGTGDGGGPDLTALSSRYTYAGLLRFLRDPAPPMPRLYPDTLPEQDVRDVARYVIGLH
jgi:alcohol dehydrogenase (cytochrome c)